MSRDPLILIVLLLLPSLAAIAAPPPPASADDTITALDRTIDWYRRVNAADRTPTSAEEILFDNFVRQASRQVMRLGFDFARAQAALLQATDPATPPTTNPADSRGRRMAQSAANIEQRIAQVKSQIDAVATTVATTAPTSRPVFNARLAKLRAELNLLQTRRDALQTVVGLNTTPDAGPAAALLQKIDDLENSVPEVKDAESSQTTSRSATNAVAATPQLFRPESAGVLSLFSELFTLSRRMSELGGLADQAQSLHELNDKARAPLRAAMQEAIRRQEALATTNPADDPERLAADARELDALAVRFKSLSSVLLPLNEQSRLLDAARGNLLDWRGVVLRQYGRILRTLLFRVGTVAAIILVLLVISALWKRATFRYVGDVRRRRQFLLARKILLSVVISLVVVASVVTEFGSLATFAGLITAGIAVALQTVILSGVAHFFFMGRYGVRVGDRVTVSNITGEVIEIGLFRLYLMELAGKNGALNPTGRVVVFSNSVLFQPSAFYKQLPGADYAWRELALTLAPGSDYRLAETRLMSALKPVFDEYRDAIERQHARVRETASLRAAGTTDPAARVRLVDAGLELVIRYPVELARAAEIDDRVTRTLLDTIESESTLRLVATSPPTIQATTRPA